MEVIIDQEQNRAYTTLEGHTAYVEFVIEGNTLDIIHTYVPNEIEGNGVASELVKRVYDYGLRNGLYLSGRCKYADIWLKRHKSYAEKQIIK